VSIKRVILNIVYFSERTALKAKRSPIAKWSLGRGLIDLILFPSDLIRILHGYKSRFGSYPNLITPPSFNEYLQQSKLIRRKSLYTQCADKLLVRSYVERKIGASYLTPLLWSGTDLREVDTESLPSSFIIKTNHASGTNIIVRNKEDLDWDSAYQKTAKWLATDYSLMCAEWQYRWIEPRVMIEKLLVGNNGDPPIDYKFFCFHGKVELLQIDFDRLTRHTRNMYDRHFNLIPLRYQYPNHQQSIEKPRCFDEMIHLAEILSNNEPFVRVDFYDVNGPIFGEITFHPEAGYGRFEPEEYNNKLGALVRSRR
jgi:hypothetical protein